MNTLLAVALVCSAATLQADCNRDNAIDVTISTARTPYECLFHSQAGMARTHLADGDYVKIVCERRKMAGLRD